jgi:putative aldouronate transport system permease protein
MRKTSVLKTIKKQRYLFLLMLPALICVILFNYAPLTGLWMSVTNYTPTANGYFQDLFGAPWAGFEWFQYFIDNDFARVMKNTLGISLLTLLFSFPAPIILAVLINEVKAKWFKRGVQTTSYLPYFVSWVIAANMLLTLLSSQGAINQLLQFLGFTDKAILFLNEGKYFWWILALVNTWKVMGYNAIIFMAGISGVSQEQYEAAEIDGCRRWQKIFYITLPCIKPTIIVMFILAVGNVLNAGFEQIILLENPAIYQFSDVLDTYSYRYGIGNGMYSYATAVGLFRSVVTFALVLIANTIAKKTNDTSLF